MKFGFRTPSLKRRIAARTSWKRIVRHSMGLKIPRGYGVLTNPKKALYNKVYRKTTFGIADVARFGSKSNPKTTTPTATAATPQATVMVSTDTPYTISPQSFIQLLKTSEPYGQDTLAIIVIVFGVLALFGNPILGVPLLAGGGYWMYRITKKPWYIVKKNLKKAKSLLKTNNFEEAVPLLQEATKLDNADLPTHYFLGVALQVTGKCEESVEHLKKYISENPSDLDAELVLAYSYYKLKKYKEAVPILQKMPPEHRNYPLIILLLGDSFLGLDEYDLAIDVFKRGPLRKINLDSYLLHLHYALGIAYKEKGDKANAVRELKRVYAYDINYRDVEKELASLETK